MFDGFVYDYTLGAINERKRRKRRRQGGAGAGLEPTGRDPSTSTHTQAQQGLHYNLAGLIQLINHGK